VLYTRVSLFYTLLLRTMLAMPGMLGMTAGMTPGMFYLCTSCKQQLNLAEPSYEVASFPGSHS